MILVNDKPLSDETLENGRPKDLCMTLYKRAIKEMQGGKDLNRNPLVIVWTDDKMIINKETKQEEWPSGVRIPLTETFFNPETKREEKWVVYKNYKTGKNGEKIYLPKRYRFTGRAVFKAKDTELAFFMAYISSHCLNSKYRSINEQKHIHFQILDKIGKAKDRADEMRKETQLRELIYGIQSLPMDSLRVIAKSYFIYDVDKKMDDEVRNALWDYINDKGSHKERIKSFLEDDHRVTELVTVRSKVQEAITSKRIGICDKGKNKIWAFLDEKDLTKAASAILTIPRGREEQATKILLQEVLSNKDLRDSILDNKLFVQPKSDNTTSSGNVIDLPEIKDDDLPL